VFASVTRMKSEEIDGDVSLSRSTQGETRTIFFGLTLKFSRGFITPRLATQKVATRWRMILNERSVDLRLAGRDFSAG
jgi:hypothetical protein